MHVAALLLLLTPPAASAAPARLADDSLACAGRTVRAVEVRRPERTRMDGAVPGVLRVPVNAVLRGAPSHLEALRPFVLLRAGEPCTPLRLRESARLLRALPYVADATLRTEPDGDGVRVVVETTDDLRPVLSGSERDGTPTRLRLGTLSLAGRGLAVDGRWSDGGARRDGFGFALRRPFLAGRPIALALAAERRPLGHDASASVGQPFLTDLQRRAWHLGARGAEDWLVTTRSTLGGPDLRLRREVADGALLARLGGGGVVLLGGVGASHEWRRAGRAQAAGGVEPLPGAEGNRTELRVAPIVGVRLLSFARVEAFDGLAAVQDVARGVQLLGAFGAGSGAARHGFGALDAYAGVGGARRFVGLRATLDATRDADGAWDDAVVGGRLAYYARPTRRETTVLSAEYAGTWRTGVPVALRLDGGFAGLLAYRGLDDVAGARRLMLRAERRLQTGGIGGALGLGVAGFAETGAVWRGSLPYGRDSGWRPALGASLLAAVPRDSRRLLRADVAVPLRRPAGVRTLAVRVGYTGAIRGFWREPADLAAARSGFPLARAVAMP